MTSVNLPGTISFGYSWYARKTCTNNEKSFVLKHLYVMEQVHPAYFMVWFTINHDPGAKLRMGRESPNGSK